MSCVQNTRKLLVWLLQVSWCKVEVTLDSPKSLITDAGHVGITNRPAPPVTVASISLKTMINAGTQQHEVREGGMDVCTDVYNPKAEVQCW
jgi:hypothetical protein